VCGGLCAVEGETGGAAGIEPHAGVRSDFWIVTIFLDFAGGRAGAPGGAKSMQGMEISLLRGKGITVAMT
jgi:hypothetical protein